MLLEQISKEDMKKYVKEYYNYAKSLLDINKAPKIKFVQNQKNAEDFLGKTGYYNPDNMTIHLYVTDRHTKDIVRSFAHELIHHYQNLNEKLPKEILHKTKDVDYASKDSHLRDMEREAFEKGNMMFRDWTDSLKVKKLKENNMNKLELEKELLKRVKTRLLKEASEKNLDPVGEEDEDVDNDGDNDSTDKYLKNRRKKIGKSMDEKYVSKTKERKTNEQKELVETDPRYVKLFEEPKRIMDDHKTTREEIIFQELMKRFIK